jgi:hypothetical protein
MYLTIDKSVICPISRSVISIGCCKKCDLYEMHNEHELECNATAEE